MSTEQAIEAVKNAFREGIAKVAGSGGPESRRVGAELKFPLVRPNGEAAARGTVDALWAYLAERGWNLDHDGLTGAPSGARQPGEKNDTVASCETGYCKVELSLSHVGDLFALKRQLDGLPALLEPFAEAHDVRFLCLGIHPVTPPSQDLLAKKGRASFWDRVFPSNQMIPPEQGDDVHLFTVNAASHVHVSLPEDEAVTAINVLNGFAGAQIALGADSTVWRGEHDASHACIAERLWDWWAPAQGRVGVPGEAFRDVAHYAEHVGGFKPVYVKRHGKPVVLKDYDTFFAYYGQTEAQGEDADGRPVAVTPAPGDLDTHNSCYWYNTRISRYYTVENRVWDQQPQDALIAPAAVTLGLASALPEAWEELKAYPWEQLRQARVEACKRGLDGAVNGLALKDFAGRMLEIARHGLASRGWGEEKFLELLAERVRYGVTPAMQAAESFAKGGAEALVEARRLRK